MAAPLCINRNLTDLECAALTFDEACAGIGAAPLRALFYYVVNGDVAPGAVPEWCAPLHWKSMPYVPTKKFSVTPTVFGSVFQMGCEPISHGGRSISFNLTPATAAEVHDVLTLFRESNDTTMNTNGMAYRSHWGETLMIQFAEAPVVTPIGSCLFEITGNFLVTCEICPFDPRSTCCVDNMGTICCAGE